MPNVLDRLLMDADEMSTEDAEARIRGALGQRDDGSAYGTSASDQRCARRAIGLGPPAVGVTMNDRRVRVSWVGVDDHSGVVGVEHLHCDHTAPVAPGV